MPVNKRQKKQRQRKTRKVQKHTYKGGKYISEGSYGCGYLPALRCEGEAERVPGMFSKLMETSEAEKEFAIGQRWFKPVDPKHQYFLYPMKICPVNQGVLPNPENNVETCEGKFDSLDDARLLQFYNGGPDIGDLKIKSDEYVAYFTGFKNLFDGLVKLHKKDIAHMDIKLPNVVGQKDSPKSFHLRFIDFGLAINSKEFDLERSNVYRGSYLVWPFETRFITYGYSEESIFPSRVTQFNIHISNIVRYAPADIFLEEDYKTKIYNENTFKYIYERFLGIPENDRVPFIIKGTDVYSMGILLSMAYGKKIGHFYNFDRKLVQDPENPMARVSLATFRTMVPDDVYRWHADVFDNISVPFFTLIKNMMNIDPFSRISIEEARDRYISLLPAMARLFKKDMIEKALQYILPITVPEPLFEISPNTVKPFSLSPLKSKKNRQTRKTIFRANAPEFVPGK